MRRVTSACPVGRDTRNEKNAVCLSCQKQEITCPFPSTMRVNTVQKANLEAAPEPAPAKRGKRPNKTEQAYYHRLVLEFPGARIRYEAITIHMDNGHAYTPDWVVTLPDGSLLLVEVKARGKNGFRHGSYQRAKVAFDQCKVDYPHWKWRWAEKCGVDWTITE